MADQRESRAAQGDRVENVSAGIVWGSGAQMAATVLTAALSLVIIRLLTAGLGLSGYGVYAAAVALVTVFSATADLGIGATVTVRIGRDRTEAPSLVGSALVLRIALSGLAVPAIFGVAWVAYGPGIHTQTVLFASLFLIFDGLRAVANAFAQATLRGALVALFAVVQQLALTFAVCLVIASWASPIYAALAFAFSGAVSGVLALAVLRRLTSIALVGSAKSSVKLLRESWPLGLIQAIGLVYLRLDVLLVSILADDESAAMYSVAYAITMIAILAPGPLMNALLPVLARESLERCQLLLASASRFLLEFSVLCLVLGFVLGRDMLTVVAGAPVAAAWSTLVLLLVSACFTSLQKVAGFASVARGTHKPMVWISGCCLLVNIVANLVLIPTFSHRGAACALLFTEVLSYAATRAVFERATGVNLALRARTLAASALALPSMAAGLALRSVLPESGHWLALFVVGPAIVFVYLALLVLTDLLPVPKHDLARFARRPFNRRSSR